MSEPTRFDVVVIGAGAAGLMAAGDLSRAGRRVLVLEARDRPGGRIHTVPLESGPPVELGAEFVHELGEDVDAVLQSAGAALFEGDGEHWHLRGRSLHRVERFWEEIVARLDRLRAPRGADRSMAELLGRPRTRRDRFVLRFVEGFNAAPAHELSARALLRSHRSTSREGGYRSFRVSGGCGRIVDGLRARWDAARVKLLLGTCASSVAWTRGRVVVRSTARGGERRDSARALLVTVPAPVLARASGERGALRFVPPLPEKQRAAAAIGAGAVVKVVVKLRGSMARPQMLELRPRLVGAQFLHVENAAFPTWWTTHPLRSSLLTGWAGGPAAERLSHRRREEVERAARATLARILGVSARRTAALVERIWVHDWQSDPFARGAYSFVRTGGEDAPAALARPARSSLCSGFGNSRFTT